MRMCIIYGQDEHIPHIFLIQLFYSYKDHQNDNLRRSADVVFGSH